MKDKPFRYRKTLQKFYEATGQPRGVIYPILPFWTRVRLVVERQIDKLAFWLVDKELYGVAGWVWKIPNVWKLRTSAFAASVLADGYPVHDERRALTICAPRSLRDYCGSGYASDGSTGASTTVRRPSKTGMPPESSTRWG